MNESYGSAEQNIPDATKILKILYPDFVRATSPECGEAADRLAPRITESQGSASWAGNRAFSDKDSVRFLRKDDQKYVVANRDTVSGTPPEFLINLQRFIDLGELPSSEWEQEVRVRKDITHPQSHSSNPFENEMRADEEAIEREWEQFKKKQEELKPKCEQEKTKMERDFPFITINLNLDDESIDREQVLWFLKHQIRENLTKIPPGSKDELQGTKIDFLVERNFLGGVKTKVNISVPRYFREVNEYEQINDAATSLHDIRTRHADRVKSPLSLPTESTYFWIQDHVSLLQSEYNIKVDAGRYDEFDKSKVRDLQELLRILRKLDKKYTDALRGTSIVFGEKDIWGTSNEEQATITIKYPWPGVSDNSMYGLEHRVKIVVDKK